MSDYATEELSAASNATDPDGDRMRLQIMMELPPPAVQQTEKAPVCLSVEDKVRDALECIESGYDSTEEWMMVNKLFRDLSRLKKPSKRAKDLLAMIKPVLAKYGYHGVSSEE